MKRDVLLKASELVAGFAVPSSIQSTAAKRALATLGYTDDFFQACEDETLTRTHVRKLLEFAGRYLEIAVVTSQRHKYAYVLVGFLKELPPSMTSSPNSLPLFSGAGITFGQAFERCTGEAIEYVSQFDHSSVRWGNENQDRTSGWLTAEELQYIEDRLPRNDSQADPWRSCVTVENIAKGISASLPALLFLRGMGFDNTSHTHLALGCGCASGPTKISAREAAVREVAERDAVALWWSGSRSGCQLIPNSICSAAETYHAAFLPYVAHELTYIDITSDLRIPCVAAIISRRNHSYFAIGFGCGGTFTAAAERASREVVQMDVGLELLERRERDFGPSAIGEYGRERLTMSRLVNFRSDPVLAQSVERTRRIDFSATDIQRVDNIVEFEALTHVTLLALDQCSLGIGIPTCKVLGIGLQPYPSTYESSRLTSTIDSQFRRYHGSII